VSRYVTSENPRGVRGVAPDRLVRREPAGLRRQFAVPAGTATYNYVDGFVNTAFGAISVTDANALRPPGHRGRFWLR
jgi:hypothetical protein